MKCPKLLTLRSLCFPRAQGSDLSSSLRQFNGQNEPKLLCKSPVGGANTSCFSAVVAVTDSSQTGTWFCPPDKIIVDAVDDAPARRVDATVLRPTTILWTRTLPLSEFHLDRSFVVCKLAPDILRNEIGLPIQALDLWSSGGTHAWLATTKE